MYHRTTSYFAANYFEGSKWKHYCIDPLIYQESGLVPRHECQYQSISSCVMLASNYTYQYELYQTPSTILFGQLRRWSIWLNRVSVLNQARCTPLVYLYIELVYTRVIASGEARLISPYIHILISIVYGTMVFTGHCYLLLVIYLLQLYHCYLPFSEYS